MLTAMPGASVERTTGGTKHTRHELSLRARAHVGSRSHAARTLPRSDARAANAAMLQERARIARELHDSVAQTLYAITLTASRALQPGNRTDGKEMQGALGAVLGLADTGQSELRSLLANLRSDLLRSGGLTAGLASLAADVRARNDLDVRLSPGDEPDLPAATKDALVLISREALHNIVRHSGADRVDIVLEVDAQSLVLRITDNGRGFDPAMKRPGHFGLQSMRERAAAVGGVLALTSARGVGTQLRVRVPRMSG